MIIDVTGIMLSPGNGGVDCPGNGLHKDPAGNTIECCCNECNYLLCCMEPVKEERCLVCNELDCPRHPAARQNSITDFPLCETGKL